MQQKEFETVYRQVLPPSTGVNNLVIENTGLSKLNFHGIRFQGRIQQDPAEPLNQLISGHITLMCIPNDQIVIPSLLTEADLNDSNSFIIATIVYQMQADSLGAVPSYGNTYDFEITPKTSRSCMKGGKLVGQVTVNSPTADVVLTAMLSSFETF